jgi:hypothetical protein
MNRKTFSVILMLFAFVIRVATGVAAKTFRYSMRL